MICNLCPRSCASERTETKSGGVCRQPSVPVAAKAMLHQWEEPCLVGEKGAGTVFFSGCNLRCCFCQNGPISQGEVGRPITALAACGEEKLHKLWEGLGYYSRVRNLQKAARIVCEQYGGQLPADYDALRALPGIGDYTAGAIASISFGIPVPAVDGNVLRVISRIQGSYDDIMKQNY